MSTLIKRLKLGDTPFVPITLAEAVVVNTNGTLGITTLDKVLGLTSATLNQINVAFGNALANKQDKLTAGYGINIDDNGIISIVQNLTVYQVVANLPDPSINTMNTIYIVPVESDNDFNKCAEYICINENGKFRWEQFGTFRTDAGLSGCITAESVTYSDGESVEVKYEIPPDLYDTITL